MKKKEIDVWFEIIVYLSLIGEEIMRKSKISLLDKYLVTEFLKPFVFLIVALTIIMVSTYLFELMRLLIAKKVPIIVILKLLLYKLPDVMVQSFSISVLFSVLLSMTQMVKNNEFTAFRMGGVSLYRILIPMLLIGFLISGINYFVNEVVVPWTNHEGKNIVRRTILQKGFPNLEEGVFFKIEDRYFYIGKIEEDTGLLHNIIIYEYLEEEEFPRLITAIGGYFKNKVWYLKQGVLHEFDKRGKLIAESDFNKLELNVNETLDDFYGEQRTTSEMSRKELKEDIELFEKNGLSVNSLLVDYHLKLANVFSSVIFILLGIPLSIKSNKGKIYGLVVSVIIIFVYYVSTSFCRSLARNELLDPLVAAWISNLVFTIIGSFLALREEH